MPSMLDRLRSTVTGGAADTLKKAAAKNGGFEACPTCGNVTAKKSPAEAAKNIDAARKKMSRGNLGE